MTSLPKDGRCDYCNQGSHVLRKFESQDPTFKYYFLCPTAYLGEEMASRQQSKRRKYKHKMTRRLLGLV
jgi:hypothetical protein